MPCCRVLRAATKSQIREVDTATADELRRLHAGILRQEDLPADEIELLGPTGARRIDTLVRDMVETSRAVGVLTQSDEVGGAIHALSIKTQTPAPAGDGR